MSIFQENFFKYLYIHDNYDINISMEIKLREKGGVFVEEEIDRSQKTILVVDDEPPIRNILVVNLQKEGYNTIEASDGISALNIALEQYPDLILLDIMLPKMDGLSVCKRIKNSYNVPILMLTAKDSEIDKILGLELGADDYITKPFSVRELVARVKANLRKMDNLAVTKMENDQNKKKENKCNSNA